MDKKRTDIIRSVRTPLGFFALIVLVIVTILGIMTNFTAGQDRTLLIVGMLILIFLLIIIVAVMAWKRPYSLYGRVTDEAGKIRAEVMLTPSEKKKYNTFSGGLPEAVILIDGADELRTILDKHFDENWDQALKEGVTATIGSIKAR